MHDADGAREGDERVDDAGAPFGAHEEFENKTSLILQLLSPDPPTWQGQRMDRER